jgi:hypothetical protein
MISDYLMERKELIEKIMQKPELRDIPPEDAEMALSMCAKKEMPEEEQIRCAREILHRAYGAFGSRKLLSPRDKKERGTEWILKKHLSTRERIPYYSGIYKRIIGDFKGTVFDLGAGVNGFSAGFIPKAKYVAVEGIGQLVRLMNDYFSKEKMNARAVHMSLFNLDSVKKMIKKEKGKKIILMFKVLDSLEMMKRDYSKKLLSDITPLADKVIVSFATRSMISRKPFRAKRNWIIDFIKGKFNVTDEFEIGGEKYICFAQK